MDDVTEALRRWLVADQALTTYVATRVTEGARLDPTEIDGINERFRRVRIARDAYADAVEAAGLPRPHL